MYTNLQRIFGAQSQSKINRSRALDRQWNISCKTNNVHYTFQVHIKDYEAIFKQTNKKKTNEPTKKKKETRIQETLCYSEAVMAWGGKICAMAIVSRWNRYQCQELALMLDIPTTAYIAHVRIMYFRYHTSLGEREIEINQIKTIWNVSDEYITKTSSWRTIIISFINVIVRNYNFLFSLRWYKWMKKRHKNEKQQQQQNTKKKRNKSMNARSVIENTEGMVEHSTYVAFYIENG